MSLVPKLINELYHGKYRLLQAFFVLEYCQMNMNIDRKLKTRNENIFNTLTKSDWFLDEADKVRKKYQKTSNEIYLNAEVKRLSRFIPDYWENSIREFIKTNKLELPTIGASIVYNQDQNGRELYIKIFKKTTQDDVIKIWPTVEKMQKWLKEILAPEISDTDFEILNLWIQAENEKPKTHNLALAVSSRLKRNSLGENDIRKRVSRLKKQLNVKEK